MKATREKLAEGVFLTHMPAEKFKTSLLSAQFIVPLEAENAAARALLPAVLRRGTAAYPDMGALNAEMDRLYGAQIDYTVRKKGENHCVGFVASMIDDAFVPGGEKLLEPAADLLGQLICAPVLENGKFLRPYVEGERENLVDTIRSILNDKREYAGVRLLEEMCAGEPYGVSRFGDEESAAALTDAALRDCYGALMSQARLELFYSGSADPGRVAGALRGALAALPARSAALPVKSAPHAARKEVKVVTQTMDVTQGKLGMGFSCGSDDETALQVGNTLFGGSSNSKLFLNVREKLSLCYFASSGYHRQKGLITVSSGIEFQNYKRAYDEILCQLAAVANGRLDDWEMQGAKSTLCNAYASMADSQGKLENFWLGQTAAGREETPEELAEQVRAVSPERVFAAMKTVALDTVYFLKGEEAAQ